MKKKKAFTLILELMFLGFVSKGLSMIARILTTRTIGIEAMSLFTLVGPAMVLLITLAQMGLPTAIATRISKRPEESKKIFLCGLFLSLSITLIFMILTLIFAPYLAKNVLKNEDVTYTFYALALLIPLVGLSSLLKGYFIGHNLIKMTAKSSIAEEIARIVFILLFLDYFSKISPAYGSFGAMLGVAVGEVFQSLFLLTESNLKLYRRMKEVLDFTSLSPLQEIPGILSISLPVTLARLVGSFTYFLEPILMTNLLIKEGLSAQEITLSYGILNGYVMPILLLPGFFSLALANYLLPNMSGLLRKNENKKAQQLFMKITALSGLIGFSMAFLFFFFPKQILYLLYKTQMGAKELRLLAFPFLLYYVESPFANAMHALNLSKEAFITTVISSILRILSLLLFLPYYGVFAVAISTIIEIAITILLNGYHILSFFLRKKKESPVFS